MLHYVLRRTMREATVFETERSNPRVRGSVFTCVKKTDVQLFVFRMDYGNSICKELDGLNETP